MPKNSVSKISEQFLEQLDNDAKNIEMLSEEKCRELVEVIRDYSPEARKFIMALDRKNRDAQFLNWVLTMRVVEYKAAQASDVLAKAFEILNNKSYTKSTKEKLHILLKELEVWLNAL